jgi:CBS domain-containing protein
VNHATDRAISDRHLEVRTLEVITGRGRSLTLSSVRCPVRSRTAPVEECAHCGESAGIAQDVLTRGEWLCCRSRATPEVEGEGPVVRAVMRRASVAVRPALAAVTAASALRARGQPGAPVVDGEGRPVGWVGEPELLRARSGARVVEVMTRAAPSISDSAPLSRAAAALASNGVERAAVVASDGVVVGVLSALDLVAWLAAPGAPLGAAGGGAREGGA